MKIKLFDSELRIMEVLWRRGDASASEIAQELGAEIGWNKNTTYTVIKKCVEKGAVERREPGFVCRALITREQAQQQEIDQLVGKLFDGNEERLFASLLRRQKLPKDVVERLRRMIDEEEEGK